MMTCIHNCMISGVKQFEWDEHKRLTNIAKHYIDFIDAVEIFEGKCMTQRSDRNNEERYISIGITHNVCIAVAYTWRNQNIRIISARRARDYEERKYRQLYT